MAIKQVQLYDDSLDFTVNRDNGPFGDFTSNEVYENSGEPGYDFFGIPIYSPFGIGAGPLPTTRFIEAALNKGFDIVTLKSVRTDTHPLNLFPQVRPVEVDGDLEPGQRITVANEYTDRLAVANSFGIPSVPPAEWQVFMRESLALQKRGQAVLVAFQGTARGEGREAFVQDHVRGVELIKETGARVIEINLSCPNEGETKLACFDTEITEQIVKAVRKAHPDIKFFIKLAYFSDKDQLAELVRRTADYVDGYSAINTMSAEVVDNEGNEVFPGRPTAGVSGAPIKWAGLEMANALSSLRNELNKNYKIIALGGVLNANDFQDYRDKGADYVLSVSGAMWNPGLAQEIKQHLLA
jgi:dihydroorotate dehydrogenase